MPVQVGINQWDKLNHNEGDDHKMMTSTEQIWVIFNVDIQPWSNSKWV